MTKTLAEEFTSLVNRIGETGSDMNCLGKSMLLASLNETVTSISRMIEHYIPNNIEAVIFDFDGVIVDTELFGLETAGRVLQHMARTPMLYELDDFYGTADIDFYRGFIEKHKLDVEPEELLKAHNVIYDQKIMRMARPLPGVKETLERLEKLKYGRTDFKLAICSSSYAYQVLGVLEKLDLAKYFSGSITCEDTTHHKPHPQPYLKTAELLEVAPENCLVFEDSANGVKSAKAAGMYCIGVEIGNHNTQDLSQADRVVYSFERLLAN